MTMDPKWNHPRSEPVWIEHEDGTVEVTTAHTHEDSTIAYDPPIWLRRGDKCAWTFTLEA